MSNKQFMVVARSDASAIIGLNENLEVSLEEGGKLRFATRYSDEGYEALVPRGFIMEAQCLAANITEAAERIGDVAQAIKNIIELSVNAWLGDYEVELVYELFSGPGKREYFQSFIPLMPLIAVPARAVNLSVASELISKIHSHPEKTRLLQAIAQYHEALRHWKPGSEIICVEHIFMGIESLKTAALREYLRRTGKRESELGEEWGFKKGKNLKLKPFLETEACFRLIFMGDRDCYKYTKETSDGFEHGFRRFDFLKEAASKVIISSARYLREGILRYSRLSEESLGSAISQIYPPRGPLKLVKYLWGSIECDSEQLAALGSMHPYCKWVSNVGRVFIDKNGKYTLSPDESFTAIIGPGAKLTPKRAEAWDGSTIAERPKPKSVP